jgi:small basic protein
MGAQIYMWIIITLVFIGFAAGYFLKIPVDTLNVKYIALVFLALMDSLTYGLLRDLQHQVSNNKYIFTRLIMGLVFGGFIIYFGEKSGLDLYLVALLPLSLGLAINLYKFLPK